MRVGQKGHARPSRAQAASLARRVATRKRQAAGWQDSEDNKSSINHSRLAKIVCINMREMFLSEIESTMT